MYLFRRICLVLFIFLFCLGAGDNTVNVRIIDSIINDVESYNIELNNTYIQTKHTQVADKAIVEESISGKSIEGENEIEINISFAGDCTLGTDDSFSYTNSFPYQL